jgi:hypothetical protein
MQDLRTGYHIGYYPSLSGWDDKLHKLRVTTTRKGVHLQTKTGYYAWAEPAGDETRQAIDSLISTTFDAAEIGLRAGISRDRQNPGVARLELHIEATDIVLAHERNQYTGELRIAVIGYSTDGGKQSSPILPLNVNYSSHQRDEILNRGIDFAQDLALEGKVARIRIIVYDRGSNAAGSVTIPITSKAPTRSQ